MCFASSVKDIPYIFSTDHFMIPFHLPDHLFIILVIYFPFPIISIF